jgi:hypothetical protein
MIRDRQPIAMFPEQAAPDRVQVRIYDIRSPESAVVRGPSSVVR